MSIFKASVIGCVLLGSISFAYADEVRVDTDHRDEIHRDRDVEKHRREMRHEIRHDAAWRRHHHHDDQHNDEGVNIHIGN